MALSVFSGVPDIVLMFRIQNHVTWPTSDVFTGASYQGSKLLHSCPLVHIRRVFSANSTILEDLKGFAKLFLAASSPSSPSEHTG